MFTYGTLDKDYAQMKHMVVRLQMQLEMFVLDKRAVNFVLAENQFENLCKDQISQ